MTQQENTHKPKSTPNRNARFVGAVFDVCARDKGAAARLRRADNPSTEYQSWETLARLGVDLEKDWERLVFAAIAAAISKSKAKGNGSLPLGRALALCYDDGNQNKQANARLRRLLACHDSIEVCRVLRSMLTLIQSRVEQPLDYIRLLSQLRGFDFDAQRIKTQWAQAFYDAHASRSTAKKESV